MDTGCARRLAVQGRPSLTVFEQDEPNEPNEPNGTIMIAASGFPTRYGRGLPASLTEGLGSYLVITQPEPWETVGGSLANRPVHDSFSSRFYDVISNRSLWFADLG